MGVSVRGCTQNSVGSMKIPETSANVGAYYGNEENGQWQPNGVIIDSGVGGGVVGSGDAGVRPPYPIHIPRSHIPGYVMAGTYYPVAYPAPPTAAPPQDDFADYMWMENEEEFDKQVMQQLEEEALMEQCIEAMLEDEQRERQRPHNGHAPHMPTTSNGTPGLSLEETVSRSTLNPLAAEFVPSGLLPSSTDDKHDPPEGAAPAALPPAPPDHPPSAVDSQPTEPPEVSAADLVPADKRPKDRVDKKLEAKKATKADPKKKPLVVKSDTKVVQQVKKEVKAVKSEAKVDDSKAEELSAPAPLEQPKIQPSPIEEPVGPKPINYAAAAKANKPKKPATPPASLAEKTPPPELKKNTPPPEIKQVKLDKKPKPVQRKNSNK